MINDLFINSVLLIAVTFVGGHILKDIPKKFVNTLYGKILLGFGGGLIGILLMIYTIKVKGTTTIIDLRIFAIMIVSYVGGIIPAIVAAIIIGVYRIVVFDIDISSIVALINIVLSTISFYIIDKKVKVEWEKWFLKTLMSLIITTSTIYYLLRNIDDVKIVCFQYFLINAFAGIFVYYLLDYVKNSNELYRKYKKESTKDFLTGLYNTRQFDKMFNNAFERVLEKKEMLSCLMIDIDHFKKVNDTYGHAIGDIVLKELAQILRKNCREVDVVGRIGGEEFCALLFDCPKDQTFEIALGINNTVQKHEFNIGEDEFINITVSIGIGIYPGITSNLEEIKERADMALYIAKKSGRNRVCDSEIYINQ